MKIKLNKRAWKFVSEMMRCQKYFVETLIYFGKFLDERMEMRFLSLIFLFCCCYALENANEQLMICKPASSVFAIQQTNSTNQHGCSSSSRPGKQGPRGIRVSVAILITFV